MRVEDVMTRDVITVRPETTIHEAAALMVVHGVSGLPVADLIKALARLPLRPGGPRSDAELAREMKDRLAAEPWASADAIVAQVNRGVLALGRPVEREAETRKSSDSARCPNGWGSKSEKMAA
jgi:CBS domain-containing protein